MSPYDLWLYWLNAWYTLMCYPSIGSKPEAVIGKTYQGCNYDEIVNLFEGRE